MLLDALPGWFEPLYASRYARPRTEVAAQMRCVRCYAVVLVATERLHAARRRLVHSKTRFDVAESLFKTVFGTPFVPTYQTFEVAKSSHAGRGRERGGVDVGDESFREKCRATIIA